MKNKDAAIRVNTDKHTGLVTLENPPEWVNEEPSKLGEFLQLFRIIVDFRKQREQQRVHD